MTCLTSLDPRVLQAHLYLHLAEQMPPECVHEEDCNCEEEFRAWARSPEPNPVDIEHVNRFLEDLHNLLRVLPDAPDEERMSLFFEAAKSTHDGNKSMIRQWFMWLYLIVFGYPDGPRWGDFVEIYGADRFVQKVLHNLGEIYNEEVIL